MDELKIGTQIIYVPSHANGDIHHPDCEEGFVTGKIERLANIEDETYWCRYWSKSHRYTLRTTANSEATPKNWLVVKKTRSDGVIEEVLRILEKGYPEHISKEQWDRYDKAIYEKGEKSNDRV